MIRKLKIWYYYIMWSICLRFGYQKSLWYYNEKLVRLGGRQPFKRGRKK